MMPGIDDQLEARFGRGIRPFPSPDASAVERRVRTYERRISLSRTGIALAVVAITVATFIVARSAARGPETVSVASPDLTAFGTYVFTDMGVRPGSSNSVLLESRAA